MAYDCEKMIAVLARYYGTGNMLQDDLAQEGHIAAWQAANDFDPGRGVPLAAYQYRRVQGAMKHYLRDHKDLIRVTAYGQERGVTTTAVCALDMPLAGAEDLSLGDTIEDPNGQVSLDRIVMEQALQALTEKQRFVIVEHYFHERLLSEIAASRGCSESYIRCVLKSAQRRLQQNESLCEMYSDGGRSLQKAANDNKLTPRELAVLRALCNGKTSAEIAAEMSISKRTVDGHAGNAYHKLDANTLICAYNEAMARGWIEPPQRR
jgi:RNA polymerase sigma factor (sigma-70 family)